MAQSNIRLDSRASIDVRAAVLPRATREMWKVTTLADGRPGFVPIKGTWYGHVVRGRSAHDVSVIPLIGCPTCGGLTILLHNEDATKAMRRLYGLRGDMPITHAIDSLGKVSPDVQCRGERCDFHRTVYLDQWNKHKRLYAIAYTEGKSHKILIDYTHAVDQREARFHFGPRREVRIISIGPAVGFWVDERTGRMTAD